MGAPKKTKKKRKYNLNTRLRSALRLIWFRSPMRYEVIKNARVGPNQIACAICDNIYKTDEIQVDHIEPVGNIEDLNGFRDRLFFGPQRALCKECHSEVTQKQTIRRLSRIS